MTRSARAACLMAAQLSLASCRSAQSSLAPQGVEAERVASLFWAMTIGGALILLAVVLATALAMFGPNRLRRPLGGEKIIVAAGILLPTALLAALLIYGFTLLATGGSRFADADPLKIAVVGERWWWRVKYVDDHGRTIESANELHIPVARRIEIELTSADVIHSFWAPRLAGKLDMIPGRKNILTLTANETGVSRGQCAEYCGGAHALMSFYVVVMAEPEFAQWLSGEASPASTPTTAQTHDGLRLFAASGCGACHSIRGTSAAGVLGPDLTHVGGRMSLAAATLPNDEAAFARWIRDNQHIKPGNLMPPYRIFSEVELAALSSYLASLR